MATFADCKRREPLLVTEQLAKTTLGLPFFIDMSISEIDWVTEIIGSVSA